MRGGDEKEEMEPTVFPFSLAAGRCNIDRLLDQNTLTLLGNQSTCEWSVDSLAVLVSYDDVHDTNLTAARRNITVLGG